LLKEWSFSEISRLLLLSFFSILIVITFRTSFRASFINYDFAKEFLVYAHAARDPKDILEQVERISSRLYGNKDIPVAYDNDSLYPYWWYFRDYPNRKWFSDTPTKDLRDSPVILVGVDNFAKIEPVVSDQYYRFNYKRMWWPIEDYDNLTFERLWNNITDANMRGALWDIWFNRDYTKYAQVTGRTNLTLSSWSPSSEMRMYIRKVIAAQIWEYGIAPTPEEPKVDPYEQGMINLDADMVLSIFDGTPLSGPRAVAISPDNSIYVSDTNNHRILHISPDGTLLQSWGGFADVLNGPAPAGMFNYPSGIAISKEGFVYVADTWNHRIQKFTASGIFITMWDQFGSEEFPDSFWGPRGIAVDKLGRVYVTDTGKQRIVIFDGNGKFLTQFGSIGLTPGLFDEPVGIAVDDNGFVYVADTWNNRVQIMQPTEDLLYYSSFQTWEVNAWNSQSLDNKPFLALDSKNRVYITDPDLGRILQFDQYGNFLQLWGGYDNSTPIGIASGIAIDKDGHVWVADALYNSLLRFTVPDKVSEPASGIFGNSSEN
ncbi:MAG: NHL repeat-containing protein, partial [Anaerolineaceae bacterium]|nr:NHL repeat-containing protein [Anaerolineaceae bacterium]